MRFNSISDLPPALRAQAEAQYVKAHEQRQQPAAISPETFRAYRPMSTGADEVTLAELNKTEKRYLEILKGRDDLLWYGVKVFRWRLAANTHYTPDFATLDKGGILSMIDTKGGHVWEDAQLKLKLAARLFPFVRWLRADLRLATKSRSESLTHLVYKA